MPAQRILLLSFSTVTEKQRIFQGREECQSEKKYNLRTQLAITCSKLTIEALEQSVKYVQS